MLVLVVFPNIIQNHEPLNKQDQCTFFSPAFIGTDNVFALVGMGQVENSEKAQGGLYALLKSILVMPFASGFGISINLPE